MIYRNATLEDIPAVSSLQQKYHVSIISMEDKANGFVTALFTEEQFKELIHQRRLKRLLKTVKITGTNKLVY